MSLTQTDTNQCIAGYSQTVLYSKRLQEAFRTSPRANPEQRFPTATDAH